MVCKIAVIGAGSFVFGPSMLDQAILQQKLPDLEMALVDPDEETVSLMAKVGRRMAKEANVDITITSHAGRNEALQDANFVICSACREIYPRFAMDCELIHRHAPGHVVTEFGGIQGISYSLRQIALIEEIVQDMKRYCPDAWLLNASNPLPRVTQAAHEMGVKTAGFCSVSTVGYENVWRIFGGAPLPFPYLAAQERWDLTMAGVNHLCWIVAARDRQDGSDVIASLRARLEDGGTASNPRCERLARETGYLLVPNDDHTRDFLPTEGTDLFRESPAHGTPGERKKRLELLHAIATGSISWDLLLEHGAWERPIDFVAGLAYGRPVAFNSLNLNNTGQIPNLPRGIFVETPAIVTQDGEFPREVTLPDSVLPYCLSAAEETDTIVRAARERNLDLLDRAVDLDPTILDKEAGKYCLRLCLVAHADLVPTFQ